MKVAKEQASIREEAADYQKSGQVVPDHLIKKYNKALRQKLRHGAQDKHRDTNDGHPPKPPQDEKAQTAPKEPANTHHSRHPLAPSPEPRMAVPVVGLMTP